MATGGKDPPDKYSDRYYKCDPKTKVKTLFCIICEEAYHHGHLKQTENFKIISDALIICPEHADLHLTSKIDHMSLTEEVRILIAQIKEEAKHKVRQELLTEISDESNITNEDSSEIANLKMELTLLKQLNTEITDKNKILKELNFELKEKNDLCKEKLNNGNIFNQTRRSYADSVSSYKTQPKKVAKLSLKRLKDEENSDMRQCVAHYLIKEKNIQTTNLYIKNKNEISVNFANEESVKAAEKVLTRKLSNIYAIETEKLAQPKLKIVGINKEYGADKKALQQDIQDRNFEKFSTKCTVQHIYTNEKTNTQSAIVEVSPEIYKHVREANYRIFIGYQCCRAYDLINVRPCNKCGRFGHNTKKCQNSAICLRCTGNHETTKCIIGNNVKCINCLFSNRKYNTNYNTNHKATDQNNCEIYKAKIKKSVDMTEYPIPPVLSTFKDKVENALISKYKNTTRAFSLNNVQSPTMTNSQSLASLSSIDGLSSSPSLMTIAAKKTAAKTK